MESKVIEAPDLDQELKGPAGENIEGKKDLKDSAGVDEENKVIEAPNLDQGLKNAAGEYIDSDKELKDSTGEFLDVILAKPPIFAACRMRNCLDDFCIFPEEFYSMFTIWADAYGYSLFFTIGNIAAFSEVLEAAFTDHHLGWRRRAILWKEYGRSRSGYGYVFKNFLGFTDEGYRLLEEAYPAAYLKKYFG